MNTTIFINIIGLLFIIIGIPIVISYSTHLFMASYKAKFIKFSTFKLLYDIISNCSEYERNQFHTWSIFYTIKGSYYRTIALRNSIIILGTVDLKFHFIDWIRYSIWMTLELFRLHIRYKESR